MAERCVTIFICLETNQKILFTAYHSLRKVGEVLSNYPRVLDHHQRECSTEREQPRSRCRYSRCFTLLKVTINITHYLVEFLSNLEVMLQVEDFQYFKTQEVLESHIAQCLNVKGFTALHTTNIALSCTLHI